jgi:hypothetical protein
VARARVILGALAKVTRRDRKSIFSFSTNNLFYVGIAFLFTGDPGAMVFFGVIIAVVLFFPLTGDPLRKIPPERLALWPLTRRERWVLRAASAWLNPIVWMLLVLLAWRRVTPELWTLVAMLLVLGFAAPWKFLSERGCVWLWLPSFPAPLNQLIRKNLREMFATLDFYAALAVALPAAVIRGAGELPAAAFLPLSLLILLPLSTCALSLFGLDEEGAITRYRLLPISGWQILAAKDVVFLLVSVLLTAPFRPLAGLAAALMALAAGHFASVKRHGHERRWRFQTSESFAASLTEIVPMIAAGAAAVQWNSLVLVACLVLYILSTWRAGHVLEGRFSETL